jgi:phosphatidylserine decarboxylase
MAGWFILGRVYFPLWLIWAGEILLFSVMVFMLAFFRDPNRMSPEDVNLLLSPADGTVADIETVMENEFIKGQAIRIGIFLSVFNVHINRSPCYAKVEQITYTAGQFKDARNPLAGQVNESNNLGLLRMDEPKDLLLVRQISGAIARRIVCSVLPGYELAGGEQFGMIKFGSRTELYLACNKRAKVLVKVGDNVKAGLTAIVRYENAGISNTGR